MSYYIKSNKSADAIKRSDNISQCVHASSRGWQHHIFIDFTIPTGFNSLSYPKACISFAWNNLSAKRKYCSSSVDYIVLDKSAVGGLSGALFDEVLKNTDAKVVEALLDDRRSRAAIISGEYFDNRKFKLVCDFDTVAVYAAQNLAN